MKRFKREAKGTVRAQSTNSFALVFGCVLGSGCFLMPGTVFLPQAGPVGGTPRYLAGRGSFDELDGEDYLIRFSNKAL